MSTALWNGLYKIIYGTTNVSKPKCVFDIKKASPYSSFFSQPMYIMLLYTSIVLINCFDIYLYIYIYICIYIYVFIYIYIHTYIHTYKARFSCSTNGRISLNICYTLDVSVCRVASCNAYNRRLKYMKYRNYAYSYRYSLNYYNIYILYIYIYIL